MITKNKYDGSYEVEKESVVNGELLTFIVSHTLNQANPKMSGWFVQILTHDPETGEIDWGFCSGWLPSYPEALAILKSNEAYKRYTFPC